MEIANLQTLEVVGEYEFRANNPAMIFANPMPADILLGLGYAIVTYDPHPELADGEQMEPGALRKKGKKVIRGWTVIPAAPLDWAALIAERRWQAETAGVDVGGMHIETNDRTKTLLNGAVMRATIDPTHTRRWKNDGVFITLDAETITRLGMAVDTYVQACFDREDELLAAVADGSINTEMLGEGWPGQSEAD